MSKHKFTNCRVQCEAIHTSSNRQHQDGRRRVQAVSRTSQVLARLAHIDYALLNQLLCIVVGIHWAFLIRLVDTKDGANRDASINVGRAIQRVEHYNVVARVSIRNVNSHWEVLLLRGQHTRAAAASKAILEHIVRHNVQFLLVLSLDVLEAGHTGEVADAGTINQASDLLASQRGGGNDDRKLVADGAGLLQLEQPAGQGLDVVR
mmetsp:Transcript_19589/g.58085  ORF Transcript_19589/g.58085 Transcript_19589/m.58085 type:complete len:206 (+) Transcript_19589:493-1110(+)